jgi:hypothetical protein
MNLLTILNKEYSMPNNEYWLWKYKLLQNILSSRLSFSLLILWPLRLTTFHCLSLLDKCMFSVWAGWRMMWSQIQRLSLPHEHFFYQVRYINVENARTIKSWFSFKKSNTCELLQCQNVLFYSFYLLDAYRANYKKKKSTLVNYLRKP